MRILVVEDDIKTSEYLCTGLKENYYIPDAAQDGLEGLYLARNNPYSVIILDVMMPHIDGWTFIQKLRETDNITPVIFLSARGNVADRVKGIDLGGDDYLLKPFAFSELLVRIRAVLRRTQPLSTDIIQIGDLTLDVQKHKVTRGELPIHLSAKEFLLLQFMVKRTGQVLSRTLIAEQVWDINFDSDTNVVDVAIKRLRDKIEQNGQKKLIHTVRGVGYVFELR